MTKICSKCRQDKDINEFAWKSKPKGKRSSWCKECMRTKVRAIYNADKRYYIDKAERRRQTNRESIVRNVITYLLEHPCVDCGESDPLALTFDHLRDKKIGIARMMSGDWEWSAVLSEIAKCDVRCANCHNKKTAREGNWLIYRLLQEQTTPR